jgi:purine-nucleoside phosphorylase
MVIGTEADVPVVVMQGRVHLYEGYTAQDVAFPIRVFARVGVRALIITNAAGAIHPEYQQGALVLIRDHINLQGQNPLVGHNDERFGLRFPDMSHAYSSVFRETARKVGQNIGQQLREGIYAALLGPSYETPAEIRFLRTIGADMVGMSTVPEVIAARHAGMEVLGISCITNTAAGLLEHPLDHAEVVETAARVRGEFAALLHAVIPALAKQLP